MSRAAAIDNLTWRLKDGKSVGRLTLADLIDADLSGPRCEGASADVRKIVLAESGERAALADAYVDAVITRFLADPKREALIREEAATIACDEAWDERVERELAL